MILNETVTKGDIMVVIGLTGGSGSGKSTAASFIREKGIKVIDADAIARRITEKGSPALERLVSAFGPDILLSDGSLNRRQMAARIFTCSDEKRILESIVTEEVVREIDRLVRDERAQGREEVLVLDAPTLFETGADSLCDQVWLVVSHEKLRIERLKARDGVEEAAIKARMAGQLSDRDKAARADVVIENNSTASDLKEKVDRLVDRVTARV